MIQNIESAAKDGTLRIFGGLNGIEEKDKAKMAAYRTLAQENGFKIGLFHYNRPTQTLTATITKI